MNPNLPVFDSLPEILHVEFFCQVCPVMHQPPGDLFALTLGQEFCGRRVVTHNEVGDDCDDEGNETLDNLKI